MSRKQKTKTEKQHLADVAELGCIACRMDGFIEFGECQATPHHITTGKGMGEMRSDFETIPLCYEHHQGKTISVHGTPEKFRMTFGKETDLLELTKQDLKELRAQKIGG
ncbi:Ref family recombination enhancement nuclease [Salinisphaera sp. G21_0]|uniref:Ref family recombination enhancement nuclease n=1 Tax=Salinisphaera sp. G21_0 TaxID=2821094 RepID=UPI001AD976D5|nr:Ref family recombination enhancement nuclease [Salinisphaera sp. G21_0]MBO9484344.1 DUF968 domain-containing protein [Salinisphaera sp. G21_0]